MLSQKGVPYVEKYVDEDRAAAIEMIRRSGQQGVPVTVIGDEVVVGFDKPRLERIVASLSQATPQARGMLGASPWEHRWPTRAAILCRVLRWHREPM